MQLNCHPGPLLVPQVAHEDVPGARGQFPVTVGVRVEDGVGHAVEGRAHRARTKHSCVVHDNRVHSGYGFSIVELT